MARWEPDARGRLTQAAMQLYAERGFDNTTAAEIAARAGLTERSFFRIFADKREVLFDGAAALQEFLVRQVCEAAPSASPIDAIVGALAAAGTTYFADRLDFARSRQALIAANPQLQERELIKLALLATALADTLRRRGVGEPTASLAAEAGISIFKTAVQCWVEATDNPPLAEVIQHIATELKAITMGSTGL